MKEVCLFQTKKLSFCVMMLSSEVGLSLIFLLVAVLALLDQKKMESRTRGPRHCGINGAMYG